MVQCENVSATKTAQGGNKSSAYGNGSEMKKASQKNTSSAKDSNRTGGGGWGQFKNESYFKSLHHC